MAWTAPHTWAPHDLANAGAPGVDPDHSLNVQLRDNLLLLATPITTATGKIAGLTASEWDSLSGTGLTDVGILAAANGYTAGTNNFNGGATVRLVIPVGADKWGT